MKKKKNLLQTVPVTKTSEQLKRELESFGIYSPHIKEIDPLGNNVFHDIAAADPKYKLYLYMKPLKETGIDIDLKNEFDLPPVFYAICRRYHYNLKMLYANKANLTLFGKGVHILDYATFMELDKTQFDWLENIFIEKYPDNLFVYYSGIQDQKLYLKKIKLIENKISHIDAKPDPYQCTALSQAVDEKNFTTVRYLLEKKADPTVTNAKGYNPLFIAIQKNYIDMVTFLLSQNNSLIFSKTSLKEDSVLHAAAIGDSKMITLLLEKKADINQLNKEGKPAIAVAMENLNTKVIEDLLRVEALDLKHNEKASFYCLNACLQTQNSRMFSQLEKVKGINLYNSDVMLLIISDEKNNYDYPIIRAAIKRIYRHIDLNKKNQKYDIYPLEILLLAQFMPIKYIHYFIKWFFTKNLHQHMNTAAITSAFDSVHSRFEENTQIAIAALFKKYLLPKLSYYQQLYVIGAALKRKRLKIMNLYMPEINILFNLLFLRNYHFTREDIINLHAFIRMLKTGGTVQLPREFAVKLYLVPGLLGYLIQSKNTGVKLSAILQAGPSRWENPPIPRLIGQNAFSFLRERYPLPEVKSMIYEAKHPIAQLSSNPLIQYGPILQPPCHWFEGTLHSDDPRLFRLEGDSTPNPRVLIPPFLLSDVNATRILNKSRWHFSKYNIQPITGIWKVSVTIILDEKPFTLNTHYSSELKSSEKDRLLCIQIDSPERGKLIIPVYYAKDGLHKAHANILEVLPDIHISSERGMPALTHA